MSFKEHIVSLRRQTPHFILSYEEDETVLAHFVRETRTAGTETRSDRKLSVFLECCKVLHVPYFLVKCNDSVFLHDAQKVSNWNYAFKFTNKKLIARE